MHSVGVVQSKAALQNFQPFLISFILHKDGALEDNLSVYLYSLGRKEAWDAATLPFFFTNVWWLLKFYGLNKLSSERASTVVSLLWQLNPKDFGHSDFVNKGMGTHIDKDLVMLLNLLLMYVFSWVSETFHSDGKISDRCTADHWRKGLNDRTAHCWNEW